MRFITLQKEQNNLLKEAFRLKLIGRKRQNEGKHLSSGYLWILRCSGYITNAFLHIDVFSR